MYLSYIFSNGVDTLWHTWDHWIDLRLRTDDCQCVGAYCDECQAYWTWSDGSNTSSYSDWAPYRPWSGENCAVLGEYNIGETSMWFSHRCNINQGLQVLCKRGVYDAN